MIRILAPLFAICALCVPVLCAVAGDTVFSQDFAKVDAVPDDLMVLSGEYAKMQDTFYYLGFGLMGASVLIYFLMVALDKSWVVPLTVMLIVPICLVGILPALYFTGTAVSVQSLLGFIFGGLAIMYGNRAKNKTGGEKGSAGIIMGWICVALSFLNCIAGAMMQANK